MGGLYGSRERLYIRMGKTSYTTRGPHKLSLTPQSSSAITLCLLWSLTRGTHGPEASLGAAALTRHWRGWGDSSAQHGGAPVDCGGQYHRSYHLRGISIQTDLASEGKGKEGSLDGMTHGQSGQS